MHDGIDCSAMHRKCNATVLLLQVQHSKSSVKSACVRFQCAGTKLYAIYDPPHILKNIRNTLKKRDVLFANDKVCIFEINHFLITCCSLLYMITLQHVTMLE